ncbi:MAG: helix-turn-helix transcriptional regulator [Clostridiales bacterium]|nr:helix-turn-helix transcriptional regulator [Clostridiales bacterium]
MNDISQKLGGRIRSIRLSMGINQEELAFKSGISAAHLGQIERGLKAPTITTINKIANALNITLPILFSFDLTTAPAVSPELNKINAYLSGFNPEELKEISKIIKSIAAFKNK